MHVSSSIVYLPALSDIAPEGQTEGQPPQSAQDWYLRSWQSTLRRSKAGLLVPPL